MATSSHKALPTRDITGFDPFAFPRVSRVIRSPY
jgi:hypothetical protein